MGRKNRKQPDVETPAESAAAPPIGQDDTTVDLRVRSGPPGGVADPYAYSREMLTSGQMLFDLVRCSGEWVKRRIERVEFDDDVTTRRRTTLDVDLSPADVRRLPRWRGRALLPVKVLTRELDVDATICASDGAPLPQLTRRHERSLAAAHLVGSYDGDHDVDAALHREVRSAIDWTLYGDHGARRPSVRDLRRVLGGSEKWLDEVVELQDKRLAIAAVELPGGAEDGARSQGALMRIVVTSSEALVDSSSPAHLSLAPEVGDRRRLDDRVVRFATDQLASCESFHFELVAPKGVVVREARLRVREVHAPTVARRVLRIVEGATSSGAGADERLAEVQSSTVVGSHDRHVEEDDPHADRVHLYYSPTLRPPGERTDWIVFGEVAAVLRPAAAGTLRPGLVVSTLCFLVLVSLWATIGWVGAAAWAPRPLVVDYAVEVDGIVAAVLLGPTLLVAAMISQDEHLLTKRFNLPARCRLAVQGVACFVASFVLAIGMPPAPRWWILGLVVLTSAGCLVRSLASYAVSLRTQRSVGNAQGRDRPWWRR